MEDVLQKREFKFDAPARGGCDILLIAGEHSGDEQAARMLKNLYRLRPDARVCAFGGRSLEAAGAQLLFDMTQFSVVGLFEVLKNYGFFRALSDAVADWICEHKPKCVCFVDYPGFNLHIADMLKKRGVSAKGGGDVKLLFYISPQIWAWKASRRFKMARTLDELAVIFPFEPACYADTDLPVHFVGHPFLEDGYVSPVRADKDGEILMLAGSRGIAVSRIFPVMVSALRRLEGEKAVAIYPTTEIRERLRHVLRNNPDVAARVRLAPNTERGIAAKAVMTSSGTMSLACCLAGIPGAIVYKANPFTYAVGRPIVKIKYLGIANIILGKPAWREFIQFDASPKKLADYIKECIASDAARDKFVGYADELRKVLHSPPKMSAAEWLAGKF